MSLISPAMPCNQTSGTGWPQCVRGLRGCFCALLGTAHCMHPRSGAATDSGINSPEWPVGDRVSDPPCELQGVGTALAGDGVGGAQLCGELLPQPRSSGLRLIYFCRWAHPSDSLIRA